MSQLERLYAVLSVFDQMTDRFDFTRARLLRYPLASPTGGSGLTSVDVLIVEMADSHGAHATGFSYCLGLGGGVVLAAADELLRGFVSGQAFLTPETLWQRVTDALGRIGRGAHYLALAAIDVAVWDLHAKRLGVPLGLAMGGESRAVRVYGSGGFRPNMSPEQVVDVAHLYSLRGCNAFKTRAAGNGAHAPQLAALRRELPADAVLMVDANEKCDLQSANRLAAECAEHAVLWLEEPVPSHDVAAYRSIARHRLVPLAAGEHLQGDLEFLPFLDRDVVAYVQPDLGMAGGITGSLRVARRCQALGLEIAPHFLPSLFIHLAAAMPCVSWLEDFPLLEPLFGEPATFDADGMLRMPNELGHGMRLDPEFVRRYAIT